MSITPLRNPSRAAAGSPIRPGSPAFSALLGCLGEEFAGRAAHYDHSGKFPQENFRRLHQEGLLVLTIPLSQGGLGGGLAEAVEAIGAVAKGDPSTALILAMQYLHHNRLQDNPQWPEALRQRVVREAVEDGALINAFWMPPPAGACRSKQAASLST